MVSIGLVKLLEHIYYEADFLTRLYKENNENVEVTRVNAIYNYGILCYMYTIHSIIIIIHF